MRAQATNSHNLANASTTGFRADLLAFRSHPLRGPGYDSRVYSAVEDRGPDFSKGSYRDTGRDLDVAIQGDGWIAVQTPDGAEGYTRAGDLRLTPVGQLVTRMGRPVLGSGGPVAVPPFEKLEIGGDGTISVLPLGQEPSTLAVVNRIKLVNPPREDLVKGADGLMRLRGGAAEPDASVKLVTGTLEGSNVNAVEALVNMIALARSFEMQVKLMRTAQDNDAASAQVMRIT